MRKRELKKGKEEGEGGRVHGGAYESKQKEGKDLSSSPPLNKKHIFMNYLHFLEQRYTPVRVLPTYSQLPHEEEGGKKEKR